MLDFETGCLLTIVAGIGPAENSSLINRSTASGKTRQPTGTHKPRLELYRPAFYLFVHNGEPVSRPNERESPVIVVMDIVAAEDGAGNPLSCMATKSNGIVLL